MSSAAPRPPAVRRRLGGAVAAVGGLLLFAYTLRQTGVDTIADGFARVGSAFVVIVALSGLRFLLRAWAWLLCTEPPHALRLRDTFPALVSGDALGNLTPLGLFVSEPTKAAFVRSRVSLMNAVSGIAVENLFYILTVAAMIAGGTVALLAEFDVPPALRVMSLVALAGMVGFLVVALALVSGRVRPLTWLLARLQHVSVVPAAVRRRTDKLQTLEERVYTFARRYRSRPLPVLLLEIGYHVAGVAETYVTLVMLLPASAPPTLLGAFLLESINRFINVAFKFVPMRLGVDEASTGLLTQVLYGMPALGVTLALVRKARMLVWTGVGVAFLGLRSLSRPSDYEAEQA
ncbi:MAG TPA: lysylphosphatidylglycerol synthase domain-containing protein [Luteitalea sp.]|nr:lysylphosphatidylglycerol synthase domain-containing protein [Luteitalea sp.]